MRISALRIAALKGKSNDHLRRNTQQRFRRNTQQRFETFEGTTDSSTGVPGHQFGNRKFSHSSDRTWTRHRRVEPWIRHWKPSKPLQPEPSSRSAARKYKSGGPV